MLQGDALLWFDDSPTRATADKIGNAVARYRQKYGHKPDVCYVHPTTLNGKLAMELAPDVDGVKVLGAKNVLPNHFWLGVNAPAKASTPGAPAKASTPGTPAKASTPGTPAKASTPGAPAKALTP